MTDAIGDRIEVFPGDVSLPRLGLNDANYEDLVNRTTHIIHSAADIQLNAPMEELRKANVQGTANVLELAFAVHKDHGLTRFSYVSTAYVAGGRKGNVPEDNLSDEFGFLNNYERSKYEGEILAQDAKSVIPVSVMRPGMIVGDYKTGAIRTFNTVYYPLRLYLSGKVKFIPASPDLRVNLVPVDYVAESVVNLTFNPEAEGLNFHLTTPSECLPTVKELLDFVREWAKEQLGVKLPRAIFLSIPKWIYQKKSLSAVSAYFNEERRFQRDNVDRLAGNYNMNWREILPNILKYAVYTGFMHRSDRTVYEQVLFRLGSKSRPVTYHDVAEGKTITHTASEMRKDIMSAASALRTMGIKACDRVATVGSNSTRYLTIDIAIGLVGAVSVPLYYTSPPADLDAIIKASGAKMIFIGTPKLLDKLDEFAEGFNVVSFCRNMPENSSREVMSWKDFLTMGDKNESNINASVNPDELAKIIYTSGTTGTPKGVTFTHENLRWMGEVTASLIPWKARNNKASYLSFLPMSHVVEGILATYSPYYLPAPLDIYFLKDLKEVQHTLPEAKPTVFFSVPRVYEKIWEGFLNSKTGRYYVNSGNSLIKRLLRPILIKGLLKKSGLDKCGMLIVGSAPSNEGLLRSFSELGIEIHNAYGLTEAPLVTMNRAGINQIGTVGQALPETEIHIDEDGEIMVQGPQVTSGYLVGDTQQPLEDGWLHTGDLGYINGEGRLVIHGRKKELIITSYGKNIHPSKVETLLKKIPGISEAILVGNDKPYCTALLWTKDIPLNGNVQAYDRAVLEANTQLSHPEQVKRWVILENDLSIEKGDLTATFKLKRASVIQRYSEVISALYNDGKLPADILHLGRMASD